MLLHIPVVLTSPSFSLSTRPLKQTKVLTSSPGETIYRCCAVHGYAYDGSGMQGPERRPFHTARCLPLAAITPSKALPPWSLNGKKHPRHSTQNACVQCGHKRPCGGQNLHIVAPAGCYGHCLAHSAKRRDEEYLLADVQKAQSLASPNIVFCVCVMLPEECTSQSNYACALKSCHDHDIIYVHDLYSMHTWELGTVLEIFNCRSCIQ